MASSARSNDSSPSPRHGCFILLLFIAIAIKTLGAITEGIAVQFFGAPLATAHALESVALLIAFAVLLWSVLHPPKQSRRD